MEIITQFGINPVLLVAQIVNFGIIFWVLKKYLYKPVLSMLKSRELEIKKGLKDAEDARILLEKAVEKEKNTLRNAQTQSRKIIEEAKVHAEEVVQKANEEAQKNVEQLLKEAKAQIAQETKLAEKQISSQVTKLAVQFLEKSVSDLFPASEQENLIKRAVTNIKKQAN